MRLSLETEKVRQQLKKQQEVLQQKQREVENQMRLIQMEHDLHEAELEVTFESNESRSSSSSEASARLQNVQEWIKENIELPSTEENKSPVDKEEVCDANSHKSEKSREIHPVNKTSVMSVKAEHTSNNETSDFHAKFSNVQASNEMKMLCQTLSDTIKSVNPVSQEKILARQTLDKDFPIFDGNPEDWSLFYQQYRRISTMCQYSEDEIMVKLRKSLRGEAKSSVSAMMLTSENLELIMKTLQMRFGRPELIIEVILSKISAIPHMKELNIDKLISFSNEVNNLVATMKSLDDYGHYFNPQLLKEFASKLPDSLKLKWGETVLFNHGRVDMEKFSRWISDIADAATYVTTPSKKYQGRKADVVLNAIQSEKSSKAGDSERTCTYCDKKFHYINTCDKLKADDIDTRWSTITSKKLCFSCLKKGHSRFKCKSRKECGVNGCKFRHNPLLHKSMPSTNSDNKTDIETPQTSSVQSVCTVQQEEINVLLRIIPVNIHGPNGTLRVLALCDEGSTVTLIENEIASQLGLTGPTETLCIQWTNDIVSKQEDSKRINVEVSATRENSKIFSMKGVHTVENLSLPSQTIDMDSWRKHEHLQNLPIDSIFKEKPTILIGQDNINLIVPLKTYSSQNSQDMLPVATKCKLGWSLHGPCIAEVNNASGIHMFHICDQSIKDDDLHKLVKQYFSTDSFGVMPTTRRINKEERDAVEIMQKTAKRLNGQNRYEIGLLWKDKDIHLPKSKSMALQRLICIERRCRRDEVFSKAYSEKINYYLEKGYLRKLSPSEANIETPRTWYLPHFATTNPNKPGKIRLVFDAAAKMEGVSLNDNLLSGPDLLQPLFAVLCRFRQGKIAFCGDVREMFHQVRIRREDQCSQRLLWRNNEPDKEPCIYEMQVMTFGATCSPTCAQYIKNINAQENAESEDVQIAITKRFYVDDYCDSKNTEEEAMEMIKNVKKVMQMGGFEIVNWMSNSQMIREQIHEDLASLKNFESDSSTQRILGILWDPQTDEFRFKLKLNEENFTNLTKRRILKFVMTVFDPLGLLTCFTIRSRILLQDIWRTGIGWDEALPRDLHEIWKKWLSDLRHISDVRVPRCYSQKIPCARRMELHVFCDASEKAFCSAAYLRVVTDEEVAVALVTAKARVSPLKPLSIPRLELQAAVMGSRIAVTLKDELELQLTATFYWSDSKCILKWIRGDGKNYEQFIAHRVGEIQERSDVAQWRWVPTKQNIADKATRTNYGDTDFIPANWFTGPDFLKKSEDEWPKEEVEEIELTEDEVEMKIEFVGKLTEENNEDVIDLKRFSKWYRLIRTTAWVFRFLKMMRRKIGNGEELISKQRNLGVEEIEEAEKYWIRSSQLQSFMEDISMLRQGKSVGKSSKLKQLSPIFENELLVLGSRLKFATVMEERARKPFILHPKHLFTRLLLQHYHEKFGHHGNETILNEIRRRYWLIDGRAAVKAIKYSCQKCKNENAHPKPPTMGQLPPARVTPGVRPFSNTGMDYFGPILVTVGRHREKKWGVIFTCLAVRAIHLEVTHSLTTGAAIMAIRRMIARRGQPLKIFSDNGTNLRGAAEELRKALKELDGNEIMDSMTTKGIEFSCVPPAAPHMAGAWERLVRSTKTALGTVIHGQSLRDETLLTLFAEAENIVNSRPLTYVSMSSDDPEALTPNHFLTGYQNLDGPPGDFDSGFHLRKEWRKSQMLINSFWKRWTREYLPTLSRRNKWTDNNQSLKVGDIVIIVDENLPRRSWKLGKVIEVFTGCDGKVRVAEVKTAKNTYRRPVTKLCRLEVDG